MRSGKAIAMFEVADLHTVWVQAQVYEHQLALIHEGQAVEARVEAFPGETFPGKLEFVQPHLDPLTRTVEVRYALDNPGHRLRPGMFATVTLKTPIADTPAFRTRIAARQPSKGQGRNVSLTAAEQKTCPVTNLKLGSMGDPIAVEVEVRKVWLCCSSLPPQAESPTRQISGAIGAPAAG